jgi:hypothetical protein
MDGIDKSKVYVRKRRDKLSDHITLKTDSWSVGSKKKLKASVRHKMKRIFIGILQDMEDECEAGTLSKETFSRLRSRILNLGNDQVRFIESELDERYNVESVNYHIKMQVKPLKDDGWPLNEQEG